MLCIMLAVHSHRNHPCASAPSFMGTTGELVAHPVHATWSRVILRKNVECAPSERVVPGKRCQVAAKGVLWIFALELFSCSNTDQLSVIRQFQNERGCRAMVLVCKGEPLWIQRARTRRPCRHPSGPGRKGAARAATRRSSRRSRQCILRLGQSS